MSPITTTTMATLKTISNKGGAAIAANARKILPPHPANFGVTDIAPAQGNITTAIGPGGINAGGTALSGSIVHVAGRDIVVVGQASAAGTLTIETSQDGGATFPLVDSGPVLAGEYVQARCTPNGATTHYRVRFLCGPVAASKVHFVSQPRT